MPTNCEIVPQERDAGDCEPLLVSSPLPVGVHVQALPPKKPSKHWVRTSSWFESPIVLSVDSFLHPWCVSAGSSQHLYLVVSGLPCAGCCPLPRLCSLLDAGLHHPCSKNERSRPDHCPPHGTRGRSDPQTRQGSKTNLGCRCTKSWFQDAVCLVPVYLNCLYWKHLFCPDCCVWDQSHPVLLPSFQYVLLQIHCARNQHFCSQYPFEVVEG